MLVYLVFSAFLGTLFMAFSLLSPGGGFWLAVQWYVIGVWSGFAALQITAWLARALHRAARRDMQPSAG